MATSAIRGVYCSVKYNSNEIGECKDAKISINHKPIDVSNFDVTGWEEYIAGRANWSISGKCNFINANTAQTAIETAILGTPTAVTVHFLLNSAGDDWYTGTAFIEKWEVSGAETAMEADFTFRGSGAIARET
jgi:predicted secreted protein